MNRQAVKSFFRSFFFLAGRESDLAKLSRTERILLVLTGPWMILPWTVFLFFLTLPILAALPAESSRCPERFLFFQGSDDWGGSQGFAVMAALLAFFAVSASVHLSLRLRAFAHPAGFLRRLARSFLVLLPHIAVFTWAVVVEVVGTLREEATYSRLTACDLDPLALTLVAATVYAASFVWIAALEGSRLSPRAKTCLAPVFAVVWFVLASDGQTPRAGQMLQAGWEPLPAVRGVRHRAMLAWRRAVLAPFGYGVRRMPAQSPLWFWTDGIVWFTIRPRPSRTARALPTVEPPPWAAGRPAWGLPVAADDATPFRELFPYSYCWLHHGGYFLRTPEGPVPLIGGRIEPFYGIYRDIHLADGAPYLALRIDADGTLLGERRTVDLDAWRRTDRADHEVAPPPCAPFNLASADASLPVQLDADCATSFSAFTNVFLRLRAAGFENVFIKRLPH